MTIKIQCHCFADVLKSYISPLEINWSVTMSTDGRLSISLIKLSLRLAEPSQAGVSLEPQLRRAASREGTQAGLEELGGEAGL